MDWFQRRFSRKLALAFCLTLAATMLATDLLLSRSLRRHFLSQLTSSLQTQAVIMGSSMNPARFDRTDKTELYSAAQRYGRACSCRVTLIHENGTVLGDSGVSWEDLSSVENHRGRPEVAEALAGGAGQAVRRSGTVHEDLLYAAMPLFLDGKVAGVVRVAMPLDQVDRKVGEMRKASAAVFIALSALGLIIVMGTARSLSKPVSELSRTAERLASGDYTARTRLHSVDELGRLGETFNLLAETVQSSIAELSLKESRLSSMLANMVEAVVAVDKDMCILAVNPSLRRLFSLGASSAEGRPFLEVLRHAQLNGLLERVIENHREHQRGVVSELSVFADQERHFEARAVPIVSGDECSGGLLVLHDITRLRELEQVRREFVANVSHELRTPLTSIRAFTETLLSGGLEDVKNNRDFVATIDHDAERMSRLVEDLLDLSSIESGRRRPQREPTDLLEIARVAVMGFKPSAERRRIAIEIVENRELPRVPADKRQMRQVFTNLIDNAVKYNKVDGKVVVAAIAEGGRVDVTVRDTGLGIPPEDLPRVFERFYRVEKARSRELGGTGLGLSIVKHIVEAHEGSIDVESAEGRGSTFRFSLPL